MSRKSAKGAKDKSRTQSKPKPKQKVNPSGLPTKDDILEFIQNSPDKVGKREISRAFGVKGSDRIELKRILGEMSNEGLISGNRKALSRPGAVPTVTVLDVIGIDEYGDTYGRPENWDAEKDGVIPTILIKTKSEKKGNSSLKSNIPGAGDRILARITPLRKPQDNYRYSASVIKKLPRMTKQLLGIYRKIDDRGGLITPIDKKQLREWSVVKGDEGQATDGELVRFEILKAGRFGMSKARVKDCLGNPQDQRAISLIALHTHGIRDVFPESVIQESNELPALTFDGREDLRSIPLITIDPVDARDHDDAVFAEADTDPTNTGGFVVFVAIADVSYYVRPYSAIDKEARLRGNSTYFPDRVVPMLPEKISNDLCSLRYGEDRPCLAVRMVFDAGGYKKNHHFVRGIMKSAAKLSYQQAQAAIDGRPDDTTGPLLETILKPLWAAYAALSKARDKRGPLDLNLPERKIILNDKGLVSEIRIPERLEAHRLIEEFMIQANVAAAETLEKLKAPVVYRSHDAPSEEKLIGLSDFLSTLDIQIPKSGVLKPEQFNRILDQVKESPVAHLVNEVVLRAQCQAEYSVMNAGHFGLNLRRYAHFTSPIRRYADLMVHRSLIQALGFGKDGLPEQQASELAEIAQEISLLERQSMMAERDTIDRLVASFLSGHVGAKFEGRIVGVTRSGLFVRLKDTGADGFIPASTMRDDYYHYHETQQAFIGERTKRGFILGDTVDVRLSEVIPSAGAIRFEMLSDGHKVSPQTLAAAKSKRSRNDGAKKKSFRRAPKKR